MPNNDEPVCKEKKQRKENIDKVRLVLVRIHHVDNFIACAKAPGIDGKNFSERSERTSTKLKNSESGAIGAGSGRSGTPGVCSQIIILRFIEDTLRN